MGLFHYKWSRVAATNATADASVNWAEGMAPSAVNDSARAMMASAAGFRDDISGAIVTTGTSTAYAVTSYQIFDSLANMGGQMIAFTPHATNGATVTLNVDGLGAKPLRSAPATELLAGTLIQGTPYLALYNNTDGAWYLHGFYGNAYNVPLGSGMDYWLPTAPNSSFVFPIGQAISRTTYGALFAAMGTTYGSGDGSTTFNLPDKTGRVSAMKEATATRLTATYFGGNSVNLGAIGGGENNSFTIGQTNLPNIVLNPSNNYTSYANVGSANLAGGGVNVNFLVSLSNSGGGGTSSAIPQGNLTIPLGGSGTAVNSRTVPPTIICNYIIRII